MMSSTREGARVAQAPVMARPKLATARDAANVIEPLFAGAARERLCVLLLDKDRRLLALREYEQGSEGEVALPLRDIVAEALLHRASAILIAHNHPSGDPAPSEADRAATRRLGELLAPLGIALSDHLIFAGGRWRSMRGLGLL